ncbi:Rz1-like lysis system protein LysC [Halopseudomonas phragmitis]|uniref:Rz1-like lysis system protein LysC n=1 Tax=Halopseudomonas phragmitis TaxID=1931241 RepID=UPI00402B0E21
MLSACATSSPPVIVQQQPLPAALAVPCPPPVAMSDNSADAALLTLKELYDQYGLCAGRLVELVNHLQEKR